MGYSTIAYEILMKTCVPLCVHNMNMHINSFLSRGVYGHFEISPRDSCIIAQLAFASFYRSQSREMGTMLEEYLESVTNQNAVALPFLDRVELGYLDKRVYFNLPYWFFLEMTEIS